VKLWGAGWGRLMKKNNFGAKHKTWGVSLFPFVSAVL
jgi:hypothetical protein